MITQAATEKSDEAIATDMSVCSCARTGSRALCNDCQQRYDRLHARRALSLLKFIEGKRWVTRDKNSAEWIASRVWKWCIENRTSYKSGRTPKGKERTFRKWLQGQALNAAQNELGFSASGGTTKRPRARKNKDERSADRSTREAALSWRLRQSSNAVIPLSCLGARGAGDVGEFDDDAPDYCLDPADRALGPYQEAELNELRKLCVDIAETICGNAIAATVIQLLDEGDSLTQAAKQIGVPRSTLQGWRKRIKQKLEAQGWFE